MKSRSILLIAIFTILTNSIFAVIDPPKVPRLVNDYGDVLSKSDEQRLEKKLVAFDDSTSTQIAIVTIKSLEGQAVSSYAFELGEKWGIGRKGKNNGVLFLVAVKERKMFVAPGYGLEGAVTDVACKRIVDNYLRPAFKKGNFYKGLDAGTTVVMGLATGEFTDDSIKKGKSRFGIEEFAGVLILLVIIIFILLNRYADYRKSNISTKKRGFWGSLFIATTMGGQGTSWGSFSSGSGGFGGGGGFGGFGGGSFGGGGAGGSW